MAAAWHTKQNDGLNYSRPRRCGGDPNVSPLDFPLALNAGPKSIARGPGYGSRSGTTVLSRQAKRTARHKDHRKYMWLQPTAFDVSGPKSTRNAEARKITPPREGVDGADLSPLEFLLGVRCRHA